MQRYLILILGIISVFCTKSWYSTDMLILYGLEKTGFEDNSVEAEQNAAVQAINNAELTIQQRALESNYQSLILSIQHVKEDIENPDINNSSPLKQMAQQSKKIDNLKNDIKNFQQRLDPFLEEEMA